MNRNEVGPTTRKAEEKKPIKKEIDKFSDKMHMKFGW